MITTERLKAEMKVPAGEYCPAYFKAKAYRENPDADIPGKRAAACVALFADSKPYIYQNDLIVGTRSGLWVDITSEQRKEYEKESSVIGERSFWTNADHFAPDYWNITEKGVPGMITDMEESMKVHSGDAGRVRTLTDMKTAMNGFLCMIRNYRVLAESLYGSEGYNDKQLDFIVSNLKQLENGKPETFAQALQLVWLCHIAFNFEGRYAMALGRIDQYLYPFYRHDIDNGTLTDDLATELLENTFIKIYERNKFRQGDDVVNICIGGKSPDGTCDVNDLSYCVLHAVRNCNVPGPNLSARICSETPDRFLDECLKVIGTGLGYPALMNDEANIPALSRFDYEEKDVYNYSMVGCIENFISGKQPAWSDGRFDAPRFLEYIFNDGKRIRGDGVGIEPGPIGEIDSMEKFMEKYEEQLVKGIADYCNGFNNAVRFKDPENYTSPFLSCFCTECIERGMDINLGGAKYPSVHGAAVMGVGTTADSLAAIEKTVFVDHTATLEEIKEALLCNFEGKEELRQLLLDAPKYGNNDDFVDKYAVWFTDFFADEFDKYRTNDGGWFYILMAANTSNIYAGQGISATPDGRLAGEPLSDASSPTYGRDTSGSTATLLSCSKPDYTRVSGGTVLNQKFMPSMFEDGNREKLLGLIKVYFRLCGQEIQINATSSETLKDAMEHPENYRDLVVRVSGFSAFYVNLGREVQTDILQRTQQAV